ncbi:MAG: LysM peptidoglycan-binding domain-containing protein [Gammaproteobacteria bacterium]|nr:LysM peptidoglycan-binding domain-containing protein [Gammaproteobacteria bacterium]
MKTVHSFKLAALFVSILGLTVGCASTTDEAEQDMATSAPAAAEETKMETPVAEPQEEEAPVMTMSSESYEVMRGDNLWDISAKDSIYGNPFQWPLIYKNNSEQIKDADLIYPGQVLDIDASPTPNDVAAAVSHAKSRGSWSLGVTEESDKAYLAQ